MKRAIIMAIIVMALRGRIGVSDLPTCDLSSRSDDPCGIDARSLRKIDSKALPPGKKMFILHEVKR